MLPFMRNIFSSSFLIIPFFVENYNANLFLVNFDKELSFLIIPKFLFLFILFLCIPNVPRWLPVTPIILICIEKIVIQFFSYLVSLIFFVKLHTLFFFFNLSLLFVNRNFKTFVSRYCLMWLRLILQVTLERRPNLIN